MCGKHGHCWSFLWFLFYFVMAILDSYYKVAGIEATEYPTSTTAFVGDTVTFVSIVEEPLTDNQILDWFIVWKVDTTATSIRRISGQQNATISSLNRPEFSDRGIYTTSWYSSTSIANSVRIHSLKMIIYGVTLRDSGYFGVTHQRNADVAHRTLLEEKALLTIYAIPAQEPRCTKIDRGTEWELMCEARGGDPPADVIWYEGTVKRSANNANFQTATVVKGLNRRFFTCETQQGTLPKKMCYVILEPSRTTTKTATTTFATTTSTTNQNETSTQLVSPIRSTTPEQSITKINSPRSVTFEAADNSAPGETAVAAIVGGVLGTVILILVFLLLLLRFRKAHENTQDTLGVSGPNINAPYVYESQIKPDQECANRSGDEEGYLELNVSRISAPSHVYQTCQTTIPIKTGTYNQADSSLYDIIK